MKTYLLTAAGVIFLSVIVSLIIPDGKLNKTIVFVMRMACILVLIQPITTVFKVSSAGNAEPLYDYEYICTVYSDNQSEQLDKLLLKEFSAECQSEVEIVHDSGQFKVNSVSVEVNSKNQTLVEEIYYYLEELGYKNITVYAKN